MGRRSRGSLHIKRQCLFRGDTIMIICSEDVTKELQIMLGTSEPLCPFSIEVRCIEGDLRVFVWAGRFSLRQVFLYRILGAILLPPFSKQSPISLRISLSSLLRSYGFQPCKALDIRRAFSNSERTSRSSVPSVCNAMMCMAARIGILRLSDGAYSESRRLLISPTSSLVGNHPAKHLFPASLAFLSVRSKGGQAGSPASWKCSEYPKMNPAFIPSSMIFHQCPFSIPKVTYFVSKI